MVDIFSLNLPTIVATLVVRDEDDILESMLTHTLSEGVSRIFVTDNASKDKTPQILQKFPEVSVEFSDDMTHNQEIHTTRMAREACKTNPDWIVHLDADEFWCGFPNLHNNYPSETLWCTSVFIHPPVPGIKTASLEKMRRYIDFHGHAREFKVIHRPDPNIVIKHGNHGIKDRSMELCPEITRHHYPIRSLEQFTRKVYQGANALKARKFVCERWYLWLEELESGNLVNLYDLISSHWEQYQPGDHPPESFLKDVLEKAYKVMPDTAKDIFKGLHEEEKSAVIQEWIPPSYRPKRIF